MGVLRPVRMVRVGLIGLREDRESILTALNDLRIAQVETLSPEALKETVPERGTETQRVIGDEALRFHGLLAALPRVPTGAPRPLLHLDEILETARTVPIDAEVGALQREEDQLLTEERSIDETLDLLAKLSFYPDRLEYLRGRHFLTFYGTTDPEAFAALRAALPKEADATFLLAPGNDKAHFLVVLRPAGADALGRVAQSQGIRLTALPALSGTVREESARLSARRAEVVRRRAEIATRLTAISVEWYPTVAALDEALSVENRKIEILTKVGAGRSTFALEAWVPERDVDRLERLLRSISGDRACLYRVKTDEEPPTLMDNPRGVRRFEFFIRFYSLPQATEWDPTLVFSIVFPIFFGLMLGDWGYGVTILAICLWMIAGFPGGGRLPKVLRTFITRIMGPRGMQQLAWALLPGCGLSIALGLYWDEFFGYPLFDRLFHYAAPIKPESPYGVSHLLLLAGFIGLGMVVLGFLFGLLKEYFHHHPRGVVGKAGGICFAFGIAFFGLSVIHHQTSFATHPVLGLYLGLLVVGFGMLLGGEGVQMGTMGLIEVVSHVLSYTRLVGILLASVILAFVINSIGGGLILGGTILGIVFGLVIIVMGQTFNVILGVFEPGIQGARLIFVEYFSKFYSGNGRPFTPFGVARRHTVPYVTAEGRVAYPILRGPDSAEARS